VNEDDPTLDVGRNLRAIVDLTRDLHAQAVARASHHDMPGGPSMAELGPVANVGAVELRNRALEAAWLAKHGNEWCGVSPDAPQEERDKACQSIKALCRHRFNPWDDDPTTLTTLRWWTEEYRARTDTVTEFWDVRSEVAWLVDNMRWVYDNEPNFDDLARDVASALRRLEAVLYAGEREERSKVPCIDCDIDRDGGRLSVLLVRHYGDVPEADRWVCPRCKRRYDEAALRRAQLIDGERRGTERFVSVEMAADALRLHPARVRRLASACDIASRGLLVWWPMARALQSERIGA
jgi:hypothetical protein